MKGQNLRFGISTGTPAVTKYIAAALSFDLSVDVDTEDSSTKDSTGGWKEFEANLKGWSGSGQAVYVNDATDTAALQADGIFDMLGTTVKAVFDLTKGEKNRVLDDGGYEGNVIITSWKVSAANGSRVTIDFSFQGTGALTKQA